jgi:uncharacterized protein
VNGAAVLGRLVLWLAGLWLAGVAQAVEVPYLSGRVVDEAGLLSPAVRDRVSAMSKEHEARTTNQVVVVTLPSLGGESIEDFATRAFETWKLGQAGKDNGVLVIVVPNDRRMRIEVGYGLEGTLPDAIAARIIREQMTPRFKAGDFDGGVLDGMRAIVARLEGLETPGADAEPANASGRGGGIFDSPDIREFESDLPSWPLRILLGAFIFGIIGLFTFLGVVTPGMGWFLYVFLIPFWAMFPIVVVGVKGALVLLTIYVIGFPIAKVLVSRQPWFQKASKDLRSTGRATIGGMVITSGGSSSGGGSGGGGGFSGGGGSSGGGGASGGW